MEASETLREAQNRSEKLRNAQHVWLCGCKEVHIHGIYKNPINQGQRDHDENDDGEPRSGEPGSGNPGEDIHTYIGS